MNIKIICVGKLKEKYLKDACNEYIKRLSRFGSVDVNELNEFKISDTPSETEIEKAIAKESESILKAISKNDYVIALDVKGEMKSSEILAKEISVKLTEGVSSLCFVIGGSNGYDDSVRKRADMKLSFSKMTFPHQLFRVMLLEQIYRVFKINSGEKYHK